MGPKEPPGTESTTPQIETNQDSFSLDPKLRVIKSLSSMKLRFVNYLNRVESTENQGSRFGSCNEFTLGINQQNNDVKNNMESTSSSGFKQKSTETDT